MLSRICCRVAVAFVIISILISCNPARDDSKLSLARLYQPEYAKGFTIDSIEGMRSRVLTVTSPWQGNDSVVSRLFVALDGEKAPAGFDGKTLNGYPKRIVAMSSTHVAMLSAIGESGRIVGVSGLRYISDPELRGRSSQVSDIGFEGSVDYELLASLKPDLVLLYGVDGASTMDGKLEELHIPYIYIGDYVEESPLGKAEWMLALAELCGKREQAREVFSEIADAYRQTAELVAGNIQDRPSVMLNTPYGDSWFMPPVDSYMVRLISDAGGRYVFEENTSGRTMPIDLEKAWLLTSTADYWLNVSNAESLDALKKLYPRFADTAPVTSGHVWANTLRSNTDGGNDFFESGIIHPDLILKDIAAILHPELFTATDFTYFIKLQ